MHYELVLQFRGDSQPDYDEMIALEDKLIQVLGNSAAVDGHDVGSGETNIFVFTSDPAATFRQVRPVLEQLGRLQAVAVAFRKGCGDRFSVIWPEDSTREFTVT